MSDANREAIERMFARVVAAARKAGMPDEEIRLIVDVELFGEGGAQAESAPAEPAPAEGPVIVERPGAPRPDADIIPELDGPVPNWDGEGEQRRGPPQFPEDGPLTLDDLGIGKVTQPVQLRPPPKTDWDRYATGEGPPPKGPPGEPE